MEELKKTAYATEDMRKDFEFVAKKLGLTSNELDKIMKGENRTYKNYKNNMFIINMSTKIFTIFKGNRQVFK